jgi:hypothetical protein
LPYPKAFGCFIIKVLKREQAGGTRYETHFNLASEVVKDKDCSHQELKEQVNNNAFSIKEDLPSTDNMLLDFESGDIFRDL